MTGTSAYVVRRASAGDLDAATDLVGLLLRELSGDPARRLPAGARDAAAGSGLVLLGGRPGRPAEGVLTVNFPVAVRAGGRYALIEELYVAPAARSAGLGARLIAGLVAELPDDVSTVEVGLPGLRFAGLARTHAFYTARGFRELGARLRLTVDHTRRSRP